MSTATDDRNEEPVLSVVAGIGSSAGGLQALKSFFSHAPNDLGISFVVVSHHHAEQVSLLPDLLGRVAQMPVAEASEGVGLEPNHVYVAPPGRNLAVHSGKLHLIEPARAHSPPLPIDTFLRSLARDAGERSVAIILSGTGSDGTLGVQAVKAASGLVIVQEETSAEYPGMPASAIATGLADFVLKPEDMAEKLKGWVQGTVVLRADTRAGGEPAGSSEAALPQILGQLRLRTGHDFSGYKARTVQRRIRRRQTLHQLERLEDYVSFLEQDETEVFALFQELLIGVTSFFRDPEAFEAITGALEGVILSKSDAPLRGWVPGCSTGEEAYSVAVLLQERIDSLGKPRNVQIFGTDLDPRAIDVARQGRYPEGIAGDIIPSRLERYFEKKEGAYLVKKEIRDMLLFASHDILRDPPFTRMDIVSCRNLLIYLDATHQQRVLALIHHSLNPDGLLMLGSSESTSSVDELFTPVNRRWKLYRRRNVRSADIASHYLPMSHSARDRLRSSSTGPSPANHGRPADATSFFLARTYAPPSVVVDERGEILHVHGSTGDFLEPAQGRVSVNVLEMAREGLRYPLTALLRDVQRRPDGRAERSVRLRSNGSSRSVHVVARKFGPVDSLPASVLLSFETRTTAATPSESETQRGASSMAEPTIARHENDDQTPSSSHAGSTNDSVLVRGDDEETLIIELERTRSDLQATIEDLQTANEELASSSEEIQSMNEELQSANEELETSREELQSLNEELQTVNAELRAKVDELSDASDDLTNLMNSTSVATLFLDRDLLIKRFTADMEKIIPLKPSDTGRPIVDLAAHLERLTLAEDAAEVLRTLEPVEREVRSIDGKMNYLMRTMAYRTSRNVIGGVVSTFVDITRLKEIEQSEMARLHAQAIVETVSQPLLTLDSGFRIESANRAFCDLFQTTEKQIQGVEIFEVQGRSFDRPELRRVLEEVIPNGGRVENLAFEYDVPSVGTRTLTINSRPMQMAASRPTLILLALSVAPVE